ncbi:hypothetical protein LINGRAHAP2_LOCUS7761 [Linum grandiflorum]
MWLLSQRLAPVEGY